MNPKNARIVIVFLITTLFSIIGFFIIETDNRFYNNNWSLIIQILSIVTYIFFTSITPDFSIKTFYKPFLLLLLLLGPTSLLVTELNNCNTILLFLSLLTWVVLSVVNEIINNKSTDILNESIFIIWLLVNSIITIGKIPFFNFSTELIYKYKIFNTYYDLRLILTAVFFFSLLISSFIRGINTKYERLSLKTSLRELPENNAFEYFANLFYNFNSYLVNYTKESLHFLKFYLLAIWSKIINAIQNLLNNWLRAISYVIVFLLTIILSKILSFFSLKLIDYLRISQWLEPKLFLDLGYLLLGFVLTFIFILAIKYLLYTIHYKSDAKTAIHALMGTEINVFWGFLILILGFFFSGILLAFIPQLFSDEPIFQSFNIPLLTLLLFTISVVMVVVYNRRLSKSNIQSKRSILSSSFRSIFGTKSNIYKTIVVILLIAWIVYIFYDASFGKMVNGINPNSETNQMDTLYQNTNSILEKGNGYNMDTIK